MRRSYEASWQQPLERQIQSLNAQLGKPVCRIVPVGQAVFALRERVANGKVPGVKKQSELFRDDLGHPQPPLATLVTYCHFAAIYGQSPVGLPVPETIKNVPECESLNTLLQEIAWQTIQSYAPNSP